MVHVAQDPSPGRISIHALLAESDPAGNGGSGSITAISIHALLAESDTKDKKYKIKKAIFLSTLSLRRATARPRYYSMGRYISIHALLAESDHSFSHAIIILVLFLSTLSLRRATI